MIKIGKAKKIIKITHKEIGIWKDIAKKESKDSWKETLGKSGITGYPYAKATKDELLNLAIKKMPDIVIMEAYHVFRSKARQILESSGQRFSEKEVSKVALGLVNQEKNIPNVKKFAKKYVTTYLNL